MNQALTQQGWSPQDIRKTTAILEQAHEHKTPVIRFFDVVVYWTAIAISILANFVLSVVLIPFVMVLHEAALYFIILLIGLSFGAVLSFILRSIEKIGSQQVVAELFIPVLALINVYMMTRLANSLAVKIGISQGIQNPFIVSGAYVIAFSAPYFLHKLLARR